MGQVFLSYAREDCRIAEKLAQVLEDAGHNVWWDRRLDSGEEFSSEIEAALAQSDVVIVAWSERSVKSRWVRDEAAVGGDTGRLVPVSIDGTLPPMGFRQFHSMDLSGWKGGKRDGRTAQLIHSVERRLTATNTDPAQAAKAPKRKRGLPFGPVRTASIIVSAVLVALVAGGLWFWSGRLVQVATKPTMALLPLTTASQDPQLRELASETRDSLSNRLSQSGLPVKLLASAPQEPRSAGDYIISGDFTRDGDKVVATLHLSEAAQGVTMASYGFEAVGDDARNLPERIGVQTTANLSWSAPLMILDKRHPTDPALVAKLMQGTNYSTDYLEGYQGAKGVAAKAPGMRMAQVSLAYYSAFVLDEFPSDQRAAAIAEARHAYERARELDQDNGDIEAAWCFLHSETAFRECEDHIRAGISRSPDDNWLNDFLAGMLTQVGRFEDAAKLQQLSYTHDPYAPNKIAHMLRILEFTGDAAGAENLYRDGVRWWPDQKGLFLRTRLLGLIWRGDFPAIARLEKETGWRQDRSSAALVAALKSKSVSSLRAACSGALTDHVVPFFPLRCLEAFNQLGDEDSAYALADNLYRRRLGATPAETEQIWVNNPDGGAPLQLITSAVAAPMRRDQRFIALAQRTGLLDYWRSGRPPDFCTAPHPESVCTQLLKRS